MLPQHWRGTTIIAAAKKPKSTQLLSSDCFNSYAWRQRELQPRPEPLRSSCPRKETEWKQRAAHPWPYAATVLLRIMFMVGCKTGRRKKKKKEGGVRRRWHQREEHSQYANQPASVKEFTEVHYPCHGPRYNNLSSVDMMMDRMQTLSLNQHDNPWQFIRNSYHLKHFTVLCKSLRYM